MTPLSPKEVEKQSLILDFYDAFDMDKFGAYIYEKLQSKGLAGGKLVQAPNKRDVILTMFYEIDGKVEKEVVYLNVFDVFGEARHKREIKQYLNDYYTKIFGNDYKKIQEDYELFKHIKGIKEYVAGEELLLQPWWLSTPYWKLGRNPLYLFSLKQPFDTWFVALLRPADKRFF